MSNLTTIETIYNQATVDRTGESLGPTWTSSQSPVKPVLKQGPFHFTGADSEIASNISTLIDSSRERLLISTQSFSDTSIIHATENALIRGVRVYMVIDSVGFESILSNPTCNALHGNVLLRERQERGLDLIISDWHLANRAGLLLSTPLDGTLTGNAVGWALELSKSQIDEFSAHIQHEFWSIAEGREVLSPDEVKNPRPIAEAPFTLRAIQNGEHILRANFASDGDDSKAERHLRNEKKWEGQFVGSSDQSFMIIEGERIEVGTSAVQVIHSIPQNTDPATGLFAHAGIPLQLAIGAESYLAGWDRTANGDWHSILRLTADQAKAAKALLQEHCTSPEWIGHSEINLGDAGNEIIRNGNEMQISDSQTQDLGVIHLDEMPDAEDSLFSYKPKLITPQDSLARECKFKWIAAPPIPSSSATEDNLHSEWKKARNGISARLDALDELNVVSKLPGFGRKAKELQKSIDEAKAIIESTIDSKPLSDLIEQVQRLTEAVGGNVNDIKAAEREEERKKLEREQRQQHDGRVTEAKKQIKELEPRLKKLNTELNGLNKALNKAEGVEKKKIESDIEILNPQIQQLETDIQSAKEIGSSKFEFRPPAEIIPTKNDGRSHLFIGDASESKLDIRVPTEGLPVHGTLYSDKDTRYLALTDWTHVEQGRKDAKRLNATLCASREVLN